MVSTTGIRQVGSNLVAYRDNGTQRFFVPTPGGLYLPATSPGVPTGAGGGEDQSSPPTGAPAGSVAAPVDDYPWPNAPQDAFSPLRYSYRDCTDFAAWRINRDLGCTSAPWMYTWGQLRLTNGDAIGWKHDWELHGWQTSTTPHAGWLGWYGSFGVGHVCYIQNVTSDGTVRIEEYNWQPHHQAYNTDLRTVSPGQAYYPEAFLAMPPAR